MKSKKGFAEFAYLVAIIILPLGTALMVYASQHSDSFLFGASMVVAPAYLLSLKISWLSFGMAQYMLQATLLILLCIILRKFKISYLLSFVTAFIYGIVLDMWLFFLSFLPSLSLSWLIAFYIIGMFFTSAGVSMFFHTYLTPRVYELCAMELTAKYKFNINNFKVCYDCVMCIISIMMSFVFFGFIKGIGWGTVIFALTNGFVIGLFSKLFERFIDFSPRYNLKKYFDK